MAAIFKDINTRYKINVKGLLVEDLDSIQNGIFNCLFTPRGTRAWRPDFGSNIYGLLQEPCDQKTATMLELEVSQVLRRWELRINLISVSAGILPTYNGYILTIQYSVVATKKNGNVTFTVQR